MIDLLVLESLTLSIADGFEELTLAALLDAAPHLQEPLMLRPGARESAWGTNKSSCRRNSGRVDARAHREGARRKGKMWAGGKVAELSSSQAFEQAVDEQRCAVGRARRAQQFTDNTTSIKHDVYMRPTVL